MVYLTSQILNEKLKQLRTAGFELINQNLLMEKLQDSQILRIYLGFEPTGHIHTGAAVLLHHLRWFNKFENCRCIILLSEIHALLGDSTKTMGELVVTQMSEELHSFVGECQIVTTFSSSGNSHQYSNLYNEPKYWKLLIKNSHLISNNDAFRASNQVTKLNSSDYMTVAGQLYSLYQITDIEYLKIDLALGAIDQRKIHMLYNDRINSDISFIHSPLFTAGGVKISKSDQMTGEGVTAASVEKVLRLMSTDESIKYAKAVLTCDSETETDIRTKLIQSIRRDHFKIWFPEFYHRVLEVLFPL